MKKVMIISFDILTILINSSYALALFEIGCYLSVFFLSSVATK